MNILGGNNENFHDGDTVVDGDLTINGDLLISGGDVISEYLDNGIYTVLPTTTSPGWFVGVSQNYHYSKNGLACTLSGTTNMGWNPAPGTTLQLLINVPSQDLFGIDIADRASASGNIGGNFAITSVAKVNGTQLMLNFTRGTSPFPDSGSGDVSLIIMYQLVGTPVPASAIAIGGGGSSTSDVKNPMIESLNSGGFNISNVGNINATTFNGGTILTNPVTASLNMSNFSITNAAQVNSTNIETTRIEHPTIGQHISIASDLYLNSQTIKNAIKVETFQLDTGNPSGTKIDVLADLDLKQNNILNVSEIKNTLGSMTIDVPGHELFINALDLRIDAKFTNYNNGDLKNVGSIQLKGIALNPNAPGPTAIEFFNDIDLQQNDILNIGEIKNETAQMLIRGSPLILKSDGFFPPQTTDTIYIATDMDFQGVEDIKNVKDINLVGNMAFKLDAKTSNTLDMAENDINRCRRVATERLIHPDGTGNLISCDSGLYLVTGNLTGLTTLNVLTDLTIKNFAGKMTVESRRREESSNFNVIDTIHIYDVLGLTEATVNDGGFNYYQLQPNTTYIIHANITVIQGFKFGVNSVIKGMSTAVSITFNETSNNIIGFKSTDQNFIIQDLTIIGGGGHFSNSSVGLFLATNLDINGLAPFYGRNKRCLISGCNISAPYSLGSISGFGTVNILSNFINGGGAVASGLYTTFGLQVRDGLSFELRGNKIVLFRGAQATSSLKMLEFINSSTSFPGGAPLGINACIITGNIFHPRSSENAIYFNSGAVIAVGTIAANTFLRTGGTGQIIGYRNELFGNYNSKSIEGFEISGNAGIIDSDPTLEASTGTGIQLLQPIGLTWVDLRFLIQNINPVDTSKRFALKFIATGVSGGAYQKGNYLVSLTNGTTGYIVDVGALGVLYITDMTGSFPDLLNYKEQDSGGIDTGVTSTGLEIGNNTDNLEFYYYERDTYDMQFGIQISYDLDAKEKEIQFQLSKDSGSGYVDLPNSIVSTTLVKNGRATGATLLHMVRMKYGDLIKIKYQYIDASDLTIERINFTAK